MKYCKKAVIEQIKHKYKLTEQQAKNMFDEFDLTDDVNILCGIIFNENTENANNEAAALSY